MGFRRNMTEALELPKEILLHLPLISFIGQEEVTIENYKGILEYSEETVRIGTAAGILRLEGQGLCLKQLSAECMVVTGRVEKNGISAMSIRAGHWGEDFVPSVMVLFMWIC